jgi:hypothetical protein
MNRSGNQDEMNEIKKYSVAGFDFKEKIAFKFNPQTYSFDGTANSD